MAGADGWVIRVHTDRGPELYDDTGTTPDPSGARVFSDRATAEGHAGLMGLYRLRGWKIEVLEARKALRGVRNPPIPR